MKAIDLFSCIGCHALGFNQAGIEMVALCEINKFRRDVLTRRFHGVPIYDDVRTFNAKPADIVIGGPPCQRTSVAAAVHGYRTGESLWPAMLQVGINAGAKWVVVEQPPGNAAWEAEVARDLCQNGWHVTRFEFGACDVGAPYIRRRVFMVACTSVPRLALARAALPSAIAAVKRAANARGDWHPDKLAALRVDARSAGEMERSESRTRRERIEALGDSNPPHMAEVIGSAITQATNPLLAPC